MITILCNKITIELYDYTIMPETQLSIQEGDNLLNKKKFLLREISKENREELTRFFNELRNHFGFKFIDLKY
ncbi:MAG TPA: hypothetical protein VEP90_01680 [Methylomirabilota bacterium]|nr:hypothetical protein [Methylomirabilota bacterium]